MALFPHTSTGRALKGGSLVSVLLVLALFALFGVITCYLVRGTANFENPDATRAAERTAALQKLRDEDAAALSSAGWVDKNKNIARIPIADAMVLTAGKLAKSGPQPGPKINWAAVPETTVKPPQPAAKP